MSGLEGDSSFAGLDMFTGANSIRLASLCVYTVRVCDDFNTSSVEEV